MLRSLLILSFWSISGHAETCSKPCAPNQVCYAGHPSPCGPSPDEKALAQCLKKKVGDNQCHKKCETNDDCRKGQKCVPVELFSGDTQDFSGKLCLFLPS